MGEGLLRHLAENRLESLSASAKPSGDVQPFAVEVMQEIGLDISQHQSKSIHEFLPPDGTPPDLIIAVCDAAAAECLVSPVLLIKYTFHFLILQMQPARKKNAAKCFARYATKSKR